VAVRVSRTWHSPRPRRDRPGDGGSGRHDRGGPRPPQAGRGVRVLRGPRAERAAGHGKHRCGRPGRRRAAVAAGQLRVITGSGPADLRRPGHDPPHPPGRARRPGAGGLGVLLPRPDRRRGQGRRARLGDRAHGSRGQTGHRRDQRRRLDHDPLPPSDLRSRPPERGFPRRRSPRSASPRSPPRSPPSRSKGVWSCGASRPERPRWPRTGDAVRDVAVPRILHHHRLGHRHRRPDPPPPRRHRERPRRPEELRPRAPARGSSPRTRPGWSARSSRSTSPAPRPRPPDPPWPRPPPPRSAASSSRSQPGSPPPRAACTCTYRRVGPGPPNGPNSSATPAGCRRSKRPDHQPSPARDRPAVEPAGSEARRTTTPHHEPHAAKPITARSPRSSVDPGSARRSQPGRRPW
jgi:hypothetical protein